MSAYEAAVELVDAVVSDYVDGLGDDDEIDTGELADNIVRALRDAGIEIPDGS